MRAAARRAAGAGGGFVGQAREQRVDARARRGQPRTRAVAFVRDAVELALEQLDGALEFVVPQQQPLDAVGEFLQ